MFKKREAIFYVGITVFVLKLFKAFLVFKMPYKVHRCEASRVLIGYVFLLNEQRASWR